MTTQPRTPLMGLDPDDPTELPKSAEDWQHVATALADASLALTHQLPRIEGNLAEIRQALGLNPYQHRAPFEGPPRDRAPSAHDIAEALAPELAAELTGRHQLAPTASGKSNSDNPTKAAWWDKRVFGPALRWVAGGLLAGAVATAGGWALNDCVHAVRTAERR